MLCIQFWKLCLSHRKINQTNLSHFFHWAFPTPHKILWFSPSPHHVLAGSFVFSCSTRYSLCWAWCFLLDQSQRAWSMGGGHSTGTNCFLWDHERWRERSQRWVRKTNGTIGQLCDCDLWFFVVWSHHKDKVCSVCNLFGMQIFHFFIQHSSGLASSCFWVRMEFRFMWNATKIDSGPNLGIKTCRLFLVNTATLWSFGGKTIGWQTWDVMYPHQAWFFQIMQRLWKLTIERCLPPIGRELCLNFKTSGSALNFCLLIGANSCRNPKISSVSLLFHLSQMSLRGNVPKGRL